MRKKLAFMMLAFCIVMVSIIGLTSCNLSTSVEFEVQFIVDEEVYATVETSGNEAIVMPENPEKEGYTFDGWYWDKDTWERPFTGNSLLNEPLLSDMVVYAKWLEEDITKSYTVSFDSFGGSAVSDVTVLYGNLLTEPSEPMRTGYIFAGWYKDADLSTQWNFSADTVTKNITLYANWSAIEYSIIYQNTDGAINTNPVKFTVEDETITLVAAQKEGYTFEGWYNGEKKVTEIVKGTYGNITLTAKWIGFALGAIEYDEDKRVISIHDTINAALFNAVCFDTEGKPATFTATVNGTVEAGKTIDVCLTATSGNKSKQVTITDIQVYGTPTVELANSDSGYTLTPSANIESLFIVKDSFGNEISYTVTADTELAAGQTVNITVTATDIAGNTLEQTYKFGVISDEYLSWVHYYVNNILWKSEFITDDTLSLPEVPNGMMFAGWVDAEGKRYTNAAGELLISLEEYMELYAVFYSEGYTPISLSEELKNISMNGKYVLICDIDLGGVEWIPLGTSDSPFIGEFDGNGFTISNFTITTTSNGYVGLFGYNRGTTKNLGVENFTIDVSRSGTLYVGGLTGYNSGSILNSYAMGEMNATSITNTSFSFETNVGGLVGYNEEGTIINSYATGDVGATFIFTPTSFFLDVNGGGLVGYNEGGTIINSYAAGDVSISSYFTANAGGLAGYNEGGTITNSYAMGDVSLLSTTVFYVSRGYAGGLVGVNSGSVTNNYATGKVNVSPYYIACAGGLMGYNHGTGAIANSYATGDVGVTFITPDESVESVSSNAIAGGLVGQNYGAIANCYATGDVSAFSYDITSAGGLAAQNYGAIANCYATGEVRVSCHYDNVFAGGLVGFYEGETETIINSYRYSGQVFTVKQGKVTSSVPTNTLGAEQGLVALQSVSFHISTLGWSADDWIFTEGDFPTLKNVGII